MRISPPALLVSLLTLSGLACALSAGPFFETTPPQLAAGSVLFQDDFSDPTSGWNSLQSAEGVMSYDGGGYRFLVNALQAQFWATPPKSARDVRIEVDAGKLGGPDENRIGVICRYSGNDYYFFIITSDGFYGLGLFQNGKATLLNAPEMQSSPVIKTGLAVNHLRADCIGEKLSLYVNGELLAEAHDATLKEGEMGLLAGTFSHPGVDVIFDHFVATQP
ncbi:MAG: hypothetical protein ACP5QU_08080 [Anaerolineae bacterium]